MPEGSEPSYFEQWNIGREHLSTEQERMSDKREDAYLELGDEDALKKWELKYDVAPGGNEVTVSGQVNGHQVSIKCIGMNGLKKTYFAQIDNWQPIEGENAGRLFHKYLRVAKLQND